ncbi:MAG TPA: GFA family protein [Devosia sp.]|nr:GFA family protein [Devosia sp.]
MASPANANIAPVATCHCGRVSITLPHAPAVVVECNCSLCRRYGVLWAYYEAGELEGMPGPGDTDTYAWNGRHVDFHRCANCGCVTYWAPRSAARSKRGINARLLPPEIVAAARLRHKDGAGSGKYLD